MLGKIFKAYAGSGVAESSLRIVSMNIAKTAEISV